MRNFRNKSRVFLNDYFETVVADLQGTTINLHLSVVILIVVKLSPLNPKHFSLEARYYNRIAEGPHLIPIEIICELENEVVANPEFNLDFVLSSEVVCNAALIVDVEQIQLGARCYYSDNITKHII